MLPPVQPEISASYPKFDALYRDLCSNKLNSDGTTRLDPKTQKERDSVNDELKKVLTASAKNKIIKTYLRTVSYRGDDLPDELQELVATIEASLHARLPKEDANLLYEDVASFKENIPLIALVVSHAAAEDITTLARILSPHEALDWRQIPIRITTAKEETFSAAANVASLRLDITHEAYNLHALYRTVIETSIRILEQTIHGSVARGTKAKADYFATVAEGMGKKLQMQHNQLLSRIESPELQSAIRAKLDMLDREAAAIRRRVRDAEEKLEEYKQAKMPSGSADEFADIIKETARLHVEIAKLQREDRSQ